MFSILDYIIIRSRMPHGSCKFKNSWLQDGAYKLWVCLSPLGKNYAGCKLCSKYDINLAAMGKSALASHAGGQRLH